MSTLCFVEAGFPDSLNQMAIRRKQMYEGESLHPDCALIDMLLGGNGQCHLHLR